MKVKFDVPVAILFCFAMLMHNNYGIELWSFCFSFFLSFMSLPLLSSRPTVPVNIDFRFLRTFVIFAVSAWNAVHLGAQYYAGWVCGRGGINDSLFTAMELGRRKVPVQSFCRAKRICPYVHFATKEMQSSIKILIYMGACLLTWSSLLQGWLRSQVFRVQNLKSHLWTIKSLDRKTVWLLRVVQERQWANARENLRI